MKISEAIKELDRIQKEYGNVSLVILDKGLVLKGVQFIEYMGSSTDALGDAVIVPVAQSLPGG